MKNKIIVKNKILMTHLVAGYPDFQSSLKLAQTFIKSGAGILEIQIPFSDPIADGPTIATACHIALKNGSGYQMTLDLCKILSKQTNTPLVIMTYANIPYQIGFDKFCKTIKKSGASSLIVPDLPFDSEDGRQLQSVCQKQNINLIQVVSPGIEQKRLYEIIKYSQGFIYCTSSRGTTGGKIHVSKELYVLLKTIKKFTNLSVAIGFGFSNATDILPLKKYADIFVIGSAFIKLFTVNKISAFKKISVLAKSIKDSL